MKNQWKRLRICQVFIPKHHEILRGLLLNDFDHIQCVIHNQQFIPLKNSIDVSLLAIDDTLYEGLKKEIKQMRDEDDIYNLPTIA